MDALLDLLDAITEARLAHPQLRPAVLAALRLAAGAGHLAAGRLLTLRHDGAVREIIAHGAPGQGEAADAQAVRALLAGGPPPDGGALARPLGKGKRIHAVLLLEGSSPSVAALLGDLFLQWVVLAELSVREKEELLDENFQLREEIRSQYSERNIVAVSGAFRHVLDAARRVAASNATVLLHGETGTGKELVARLIHEHSPRANKPFIAVNCGALADSLLESELFGHAKGAFTGAVAERKGRFEAADGGSIFLDEIGEVSPAMQVRLLRVLQEMEVVRVGESLGRKLDVRVIAATNRDLEAAVREERFRADLWYRLNVVYLHLPPLRQRPEDIPHLVERFLNQHAARNARWIESVAREVLEAMARYPWPGNVRELENCVEKMVVMAPGRVLTPDLLPIAVAAWEPQARPDHAGGPATFEERLASFMRARVAEERSRGREGELYDALRAKWERHLLDAALEACGGNQAATARLLGITRATLRTRLAALSEGTRRKWKVE